MLLSKDLFEIEKNFWTGDAAYYRRHLADDCMVVFTEMAGLKSKEEIASMIKDGMRWRKLDIKEKGLVELADGVALLSYQDSATRATGEPFEALVSSAYVKRNGEWKMAFHHQTPLTPH
jgi:ketosteroid isomerase-like protein